MRDRRPPVPAPGPLFPDRAGFTLVELIVVMVVIILLVGIAVPAFESISKGGQFTQIHTHLTMLFTNVYAESYDRNSGILFLRARPTDPTNDSGGADTGFGDALGFQRAIPVVFSPYKVLNPFGNPVADPSSGSANMTYEAFYGLQPYARPHEQLAPVDLPPEVWAAPAFVDDQMTRNPPTITPVAIGASEFADSWLRDQRNADDSRIDRFFVVFNAGGENIEMRSAAAGTTDLAINPHVVTNDLAYRPNAAAVFATNANTNKWVMSRNPISARGLIVYDREAMLGRPDETDRRDYLLGQGQPIYVSRFGGTTILGAEK